VYARIGRLPALRLLDVATPGLLLGQMIGRLGSLVNGESWGTQTSLPWGIVYTHPDARLPLESLGLPTHPYAVYEIAWNLVAFGLLWRLRERWRLDGVLFAVYLLLYSAGRFGLTFVREEGYFLFGLQQAQVIAAAVFLFALPFLVYLVTGQQRSETAAQVYEPTLTPPAR
jgi:phosphatidylglycerol:prolipoprotein diacylglycerol transferase